MSWQRIRDSLRDIAADRRRGARELVIECARMLSARLSEVQPAVFESATQLELRELARWVISTQPEMAPFYHLGAVIMGEGGEGEGEGEGGGGGGGGGSVEKLAVRLGEFISGLEAEPDAAVAAKLIRPGATIASYSRSGSILAALRLAHAGGTPFSVWVGESRPGYEGRTLAADLSAAGIDVELMPDVVLFDSVGAADLVWVGADAVGRDLFRNKVGTRALCLLAGLESTPVYVLADRTKFLPEELWCGSEEREGGEVWPEAPPSVRVRNPYFEDVPLSTLEGGGVVVAEGILAPREIRARVEDAAAALAMVAEQFRSQR